MRVGEFLTDVPAKWLRNHRFNQVGLETEYVTSVPQILVPNMGRWYETNFYQRGDEILTYDELKVLSDFNGTMHETNLYLCECYENHGDDGHTCMILSGWVLHTRPCVFRCYDQEGLDWEIKNQNSTPVYRHESNRCEQVNSIS